jgi:hypothetical protein
LTAETTTETGLALNNDPLNDNAALSSVFSRLDTPVQATRVTVITDLPPRQLRAVVTVTFTYRNRPQTVSLTTLRTTDNF